MIVGPDRQAGRLHADVVVLGVVGAGVFALAPLHQFPGVSDPHDRRPAGRAAAVTCVVTAGRRAVMVQPDVVASLVRDRIGDELLVAPSQRVVEDQGRFEEIADVVEGSQVGNAAAAAAVERALGDQHRGAEGVVAAVRAGELVRRRRLGGDVDIEGRVVLGDTLPDVLDALQFGGAERVGHAVEVERLGSDCRLAAVVPGRADQGGADEVQVDGALGAGAAVQPEGLVQRLQVRRKRVGRQRRHRALRGKLHLLLEEHAAPAVEPGGAVEPHHGRELRHRHAVPGGHLWQAATKPRDCQFALCSLRQREAGKFRLGPRRCGRGLRENRRRRQRDSERRQQRQQPRKPEAARRKRRVAPGIDRTLVPWVHHFLTPQ